VRTFDNWRAYLIRRSSTANGDAVVERPLSIEKKVSSIRDKEPIPPAQLIPDSGRQRLGCDHE
jgi:hypothetical protein